ncbi:DUF397 domain-containing protein [Actinocorallia libanotica]
MSRPVWRKSSHSEETECVEVANDAGVLVRDGKNPEAGVLWISRSVWRALLGELKDDG